jgi:hypothetical protein
MAVLELSSEDSLRLNVLVMNVEAVRIDERNMTVYGLSTRGEAKVPLNPTGRDEQYLKAVREFLSTAALGSPSGYPVHLNRWTRMGQARDTNLAKLLMLGEPEAITAVVCAPGLTDDLARRAWWADPSSENARRMLASECVMQGAMGPILAEYLVEHLPFETEARLIIESVRLVLQPGLVSDAVRLKLWEKGAAQGSYRIGFLQAEPDSLPPHQPARTDLAALSGSLVELAARGNRLAALLARALSSPGQNFLATSQQALQKLSDQDAVVALLNTLSQYFRDARLHTEPCQEITAILTEAERAVLQQPEARTILKTLPALTPEIKAIYILASMDEAIVTPVFARSSASGSLMRRKIEPIMAPVLEQIGLLRQVRHG